MVKINNQEKKSEFNLGEILSRYKFIWIFAVFVAVGAGLFSWARGEKFVVSLAITVSRQGTQESVDYKYDNYYAIKASDEFGDTVAGWFKTPEIASAINERIGISPVGWSLSDLSGKFKTAKISPNLVEIRYGAKSEAQARQTAQAIDQVISGKINQLNDSSQQGISFLAIVGQPVIVKNTFAVWWNVLAGLLVGLVFGFFVQVAKEYFQ